MSRRVVWTVVLAVVAPATGLPQTPTPEGPTTLVCGSSGERSLCPVDTRGGVRLEEQLSDSPCVGRWGYTRQGVWVESGCRARFTVGGTEPGTELDDTVICESVNNRRNYCRATTVWGVQLLRELSKAPCTGNWGWDETGIWVEAGCRAEFRLLSPWSGPTVGEAETVMCESTDYRLSRCGADTLGGVTLVREVSAAPCDGNWGYDAEGIWVDNGCRAEFLVHPPAATPPPGWSSHGRIIRCGSKLLSRQLCRVDTAGGVRLFRELSEDRCDGQWGWSEEGIWVEGGCWAEFAVGEVDRPTAAPAPTPTPRADSQ